MGGWPSRGSTTHPQQRPFGWLLFEPLAFAMLIDLPAGSALSAARSSRSAYATAPDAENERAAACISSTTWNVSEPRDGARPARHSSALSTPVA